MYLAIVIGVFGPGSLLAHSKILKSYYVTLFESGRSDGWLLVAST